MQTELRGAVRACFAEVTAGGPGGASGKVKMKVTLMPSGAVRLDEVTVELEPRPPAGIEAAVKKCLEGKLRSVKNDLPPTNPLPVSLTQGVTSASQGP